jgi:C1A family cysteine protease
MAETISEHGMGWRPDLPSIQDYDETTSKVPGRLRYRNDVQSLKTITKKMGLTPEEVEGMEVPARVDFRNECTPVEDQGTLGSCTAQAVTGLIEYYEKMAHGRHIDGSRLFLYKTTRNLLNWTGDTGAYLRSTMAALALFGIPPEEYWKYDVKEFDKEPTAFLYSFGQNYQALQYYRLDNNGTGTPELLKKIKARLSHQMPMVFGFTVYNSIEQAGENGRIPVPCPGDRVAGGHAVMAVGYDDNVEIRNASCEEVTAKGALVIRNSWGTGWGEKGYGYLPYEYVLRGLAVDWWSLIKAEWTDLDVFA